MTVTRTDFLTEFQLGNLDHYYQTWNIVHSWSDTGKKKQLQYEKDVIFFLWAPIIGQILTVSEKYVYKEPSVDTLKNVGA